MQNQNHQNQLTKKQIESVVSLYSSGNFEEAITQIKSLNESYPNVPILFNILGACYKAIGEIDGAIQMFETATKIKPNYAEAFFNIAVIYQELQQNDDAIKNYKKTLAINPKYPDAHNNLGILFLDFRDFVKAINHFKLAISNKPDFAAAHNNLGSALQEQGNYQEALNFYKKALSCDSNFAQAYNNFAILSEKTGDFENAILGYEKAIDCSPLYASAHFNLSALKTYSENDNQINQMHSILSSSDISNSEKIRINFALAKVNQDLNNTDSLFEYLDKGNRLRKAELNFSFGANNDNNSYIKNIFQNKLFNKTSQFSDALEKSAIFILGMPRSGTSLVEQIISSHSLVFGAGELKSLNEILVPIMQNELDSAKSEFSNDLVNLIRSKYTQDLLNLNIKENIITDKWPLNFRYIGFILSAFPDAKILHLKRDPMATCWSIYRHYFSDNANGWAYSMSDIAKFYKLYEDLMDFWHKLFPNQIYDISYENLTNNQEMETRKLIDYCGLDWDDKCLEFYNNPRAVETASVSQVRKEMYKDSSEAWKKYEQYLQPLKQNLLLDNL